ncbi:hypothetical protein Tco_1350153, partial [Tanacetum coccineum]
TTAGDPLAQNAEIEGPDPKSPLKGSWSVN